MGPVADRGLGPPPLLELSLRFEVLEFLLPLACVRWTLFSTREVLYWLHEMHPRDLPEPLCNWGIVRPII